MAKLSSKTGKGKNAKSLANLKNAKVVKTDKELKREHEKNISIIKNEFINNGEFTKNDIDKFEQDLTSEREKLLDIEIKIAKKERMEEFIKDVNSDDFSKSLTYLNKKSAINLSKLTVQEFKSMVKDGTIFKAYEAQIEKSYRKGFNSDVKYDVKRTLESKILKKEPKEFYLNKLKINKETAKAYGIAIKSEYYDFVAGEYRTKKDTMWIPKSWFTDGKIDTDSVNKKLKDNDWIYNNSTKRYKLDSN